MVLDLFINVISSLGLILGTLAFIVIYQCVIRYWNFFSSKNVKFVRGFPIFGSHYKTFLGSLPLANSFLNLYNKFPKERFIGIYELGGKPSYLIRDPELVKQIMIKDFDHFVNHTIEVQEGSDPLLNRSLFTMNDQKWRDMRSTLTPAFSGSKMRAMSSLLVEVANTFCEDLKNELGGKAKIYDMKDLFGRVANDVIASTAFGMNINSMKDRNNEFYKTGFKISNFGLKFFFYGIAPKIMNFFRVRVFDKNSTDFFRDLIKENMRYRQNNKIVRPDMINILLDVKKGMLTNGPAEVDENVGFATVIDDKVTNAKAHQWSDDDLIAQSITFFLAGFSTISSTMGYLAHEVALNPDVQEKLYQEIQEYKEKLNGAPVDYDTLQKMKYLDMVLSELLRRRIGLANDRVVNKPYVIENYDGTKVQLNVGDTVWLPSQPLHMDPKYHPNPEKFDPERFSEENKNNIIPGTFMPFGLGPRSCIASRFALMECKSLIYHLVSEFHLEKCHKTMDPIILSKTLREPRDGFWLQLRARN